MDRKQTILGAAALIILIVAGLLYYRRSSAGQAAIPSSVQVRAVCLACRKPASLTAATRAPAPHKCPNCSAEAAYPFYYCRACALRFVPPLVRRSSEDPPRLPVAPTCPKCGSQDVHSFNPEFDGGEDSALADLPTWPMP